MSEIKLGIWFGLIMAGLYIVFGLSLLIAPRGNDWLGAAGVSAGLLLLASSTLGPPKRLDPHSILERIFGH